MNKLLEQLNLIGVDVVGSLRRFAGNEELYTQFLLKFINEQTFNKLDQEVLLSNYETIMIHAHTMKGLASNLGFNKLSKLCADIVDKVRHQDFLISDVYSKAKDEYHIIYDTIISNS